MILPVRCFIGIDPGKAGGVAVVDLLGIVLQVAKMPETVVDLLDLLRPWGSQQTRAVMEKVNAGVFGQGKAGRMGVTSAFTFGRGIGRLETALAATRIPFDQVPPLTWQTALGCRSGGEKNITKARAQQLFPSVKVTHAVADALLLAEFCRRFHGVIRRDTGEALQGAEAGARAQGATKEVIPKALAEGASGSSTKVLRRVPSQTPGTDPRTSTTVEAETEREVNGKKNTSDAGTKEAHGESGAPAEVVDEAKGRRIARLEAIIGATGTSAPRHGAGTKPRSR